MALQWDALEPFGVRLHSTPWAPGPPSGTQAGTRSYLEQTSRYFVDGTPGRFTRIS